MSLIEVVARYSDGSERGRRVVVQPAAEALAGALATSGGDAGGGREQGRVVIDFAAAGDEASAVDRIASSLREHDVLVLVLKTPPEDIPVGPLVQAVCSRGLRVVQAEGLPRRHAPTVLVLTGDSSVPQRSYLLGEALPEGDPAHLRQANEWAVEGLQLRALAARTEAALATAREEVTALRAQRDAAEARLAAETKRLQAQTDSLAAANKQLRSVEQRRVSRKARRAVTLLRDDPVGGSKRLARAAARRLGR